GDAAFVDRLRLLGGVVLGILRQIAVRASVGDLLNDAGPLDLLAMLELGLERGIALGGHWYFFHRPISSWPAPELTRTTLIAANPLSLRIPSSRLVIRLRPRSPAIPESGQRGPVKKVLSRPASPDAATMNFSGVPRAVTRVLSAKKPSAPAAEVALQRAYLEVALQIGLDALRRGDGPRKSGVVRHFMQEGGVAQRPAIGQRRRPLGGIENQLNAAVFDGIHDVGPAFQDLVDLGRLDPLFRQVALGSRRCDGLETEGSQELYRGQNARLVGIFHRDENGSAARQAGAAADLAFCEGDFERPVDSHDLAGGFHLRPQHGIDPREPCERKDGLLHSAMPRTG